MRSASATANGSRRAHAATNYEGRRAPAGSQSEVRGPIENELTSVSIALYFYLLIQIKLLLW